MKPRIESQILGKEIKISTVKKATLKEGKKRGQKLSMCQNERTQSEVNQARKEVVGDGKKVENDVLNISIEKGGRAEKTGLNGKKASDERKEIDSRDNEKKERVRREPVDTKKELKLKKVTIKETSETISELKEVTKLRPSIQTEILENQKSWPPRPAFVRAPSQLEKKVQKFETFKHDIIETPQLTTPIGKLEKEKPVESTIVLTSTTDSDGESVCSSIYSPRPERVQPYPPDRDILSNLGMTSDRIINRIILRRSLSDGGVVFCVPTSINQFLYFLFQKYAESATELLTEQGFERMVRAQQNHLNHHAQQNFKYNEYDVLLQLIDAGLLLPKDDPNLRRKHPTVKPELPAEKRSDVKKKHPTPQKKQLRKGEFEEVRRHRENKILRCVFRHRDNPNGGPIGGT